MKTESDIEQSSDTELSEYLIHGDAQERVWAAWALTKRTGHPATKQILNRYWSDQDSGVRAHLLGVLAGYGFVTLLETIAKFEPDPDLRAVSCQYLILTSSNRSAEFRKILHVFETDESSAVIERILGYWNAKDGLFPRDALIKQFERHGKKLGSGPWAFLFDNYDAAELLETQMLSLVNAWQFTDSSSMALLDWFGRSASREILVRVWGSAIKDNRSALVNFFQSQFQFNWQEIEPLRQLNNSAINNEILSLCWNEFFIWENEPAKHLIKEWLEMRAGLAGDSDGRERALYRACLEHFEKASQ